jgi:uncharacterized spore protein YtfJ
MSAKDILDLARDAVTVRRVYGEPVERDGVTVIPAAIVRGGAGAGSGEGEQEQRSAGDGGGWGGTARPVGAFVISGGQVTWQPVIDVNRIVLGGQVVLVAGLLVVRSILKARRGRRL